MKRRKSIYFYTAVTALLLLFVQTSCNKDDDNKTNNNYTISATGDGNQEVPAVTTSGTGTVTGTYDASTKTLQYNATWSNLSGPASAAHFHGPADPGANAGVVVPFTVNSSGNSGSASGSVTLTDAQQADLLAGKWYFNVHTAAHPSGEIRGQISAKQ